MVLTLTRDEQIFLKKIHPVTRNHAEKIEYVPYFGVDINLVNKFAKNWNDKKNVILHVGRLYAYAKGTDIVLKVFEEIHENHPKWELWLVGPIEKERKLFLKEIENYRKNGIIVRYLGYVDTVEHLYEIYSISKIIFQPSRFESFGIAVLEGIAFGNVALVSDIPSFREIVNSCGFFCKPEDLECFKTTLEFMLNNEDLLRKLSIRGRKHVLNKYNIMQAN